MIRKSLFILLVLAFSLFSVFSAYAISNGEPEIISTTSGGDGNCRSNNYNYHLDTASARNFLGKFLDLP